eukprot:gene22933-30113_t
MRGSVAGSVAAASDVISVASECPAGSVASERPAGSAVASVVAVSEASPSASASVAGSVAASPPSSLARTPSRPGSVSRNSSRRSSSRRQSAVGFVAASNNGNPATPPQPPPADVASKASLYDATPDYEDVDELQLLLADTPSRRLKLKSTQADELSKAGDLWGCVRLRQECLAIAKIYNNVYHGAERGRHPMMMSTAHFRLAEAYSDLKCHPQDVNLLMGQSLLLLEPPRPHNALQHFAAAANVASPQEVTESAVKKFEGAVASRELQAELGCRSEALDTGVDMLTDVAFEEEERLKKELAVDEHKKHPLLISLFSRELAGVLVAQSYAVIGKTKLADSKKLEEASVLVAQSYVVIGNTKLAEAKKLEEASVLVAQSYAVIGNTKLAEAKKLKEASVAIETRHATLNTRLEQTNPKGSDWSSLQRKIEDASRELQAELAQDGGL